MKKIFCCPALELFHCLLLWKTVLFVSSRAFSLSTPTFSLSTPVDNSEAKWKKATKCNKVFFFGNLAQFLYLLTLSGLWKRNKSHAKVGGYFFRKNVGVSYHNHDDHHHAIFGGHALPSVHNGVSDCMNSHYRQTSI